MHDYISRLNTLGHGRHPFTYFLELLQKYEIEFLCDVRAFARSRWPQFNGLVLAELLRDNGIGYEDLPECGGKTKPKPDDLARGVDRLIEIASDARSQNRFPIIKYQEQIAIASACLHRCLGHAGSKRSFTLCPTDDQSNSTNLPCL